MSVAVPPPRRRMLPATPVQRNNLTLDKSMQEARMVQTFHVHDKGVSPFCPPPEAKLATPKSKEDFRDPNKIDASVKSRRKIISGNVKSEAFPGEWKPKKAVPIHKRPPWVGVTGSGSAAPGADIAPQPHGRTVRHYTNKSHKSDQHLLQSLRVDYDPNTAWRSAKVQAKLAMEDDKDEDDLPDVFVRLTDPRRFNGTHKHRFRSDGSGAGLEGRRDDTDFAINHNGEAKILRDDDPEMDAPHKPIMPWEEDKLRSDAFYTRDMSQDMKTDDAYEDRVMTNGVIGRLAQEKKKHHDLETEYDRMQRKRAEYKVDKHYSFAWQAGDSVTF